MDAQMQSNLMIKWKHKVKTEEALESIISF